MQTDSATPQSGASTPKKEQIEQFETSLGLVTEKLDSWLDAAVSLLPNLVVAILVLALFALVSRFVRRWTERVMKKVLPTNRSIQRLLSTLAGIVVLAIGIFVALSALQLDKAVTSLLAGAGVVGLALAFAFQDSAANLIAGVYMSVQRPLAVGDVVETNDAFGTVERIDLRNTLLTTPQGQTVYLPNKEIFENKLVNYSRSGQNRIDLAVGVSYAADLEEVRKVSLEAIEAIEERLTDREVELFYQGFGGSSIDLVVRFWISYARPSDFQKARSEAIMRIKRAYDEHGITIPFPIRTLDFGIEGGQTLAEAWPTGNPGNDSPEADSAEQTPADA